MQSSTYIFRRNHWYVIFVFCLAIFVYFSWSRLVLDPCWLVSDSYWFMFTLVRLVLTRFGLVLILVDRVGLCWLRLILAHYKRLDLRATHMITSFEQPKNFSLETTLSFFCFLMLFLLLQVVPRFYSFSSSSLFLITTNNRSAFTPY